MPETVFYSWQSDLPNAANRGFIQAALEAAIKTLRKDSSVRVEPAMDRDTAGVPGCPDICSTIFEKIDRARVFLCDVSITTPVTQKEGRSTPNPNVMIELGYAIKALGPDRIIMAMNTAFGPIQQLPFDLRHRRVLTYHAPLGSTERASERTKLQGALEHLLRDILRTPLKEPEVDGEQVDIPLPGRWQRRNDRQGERFGRRTDGQVTPATVELRSGELYKFSADFGVTDEELRALVRLSKQPALIELTLYKCKYLTESGLRSLQQFRHLWALDLQETNTTDSILGLLHGLTSLRRLDVRKCPVSAAALQQLRSTLANCEVVA